ncbi:MAG: pentapeptide repeat-containing protein [Nitrospira sp.]|nr:pentapeptide repeat-containing protein [Nitrospira sp.]
MLCFRSFGAYEVLWKQMRSRWHVVPVLVGVIVSCPFEADAGCIAETSVAGIETGLVIHLSPSCTQAERESHAVRGEVIMDAIAKGRPVDLLGVLVRGDLIFDRLAVETTVRLPGPTSERANREDRVGGNGQRIVHKALSLRDSVVLGAVRHRATDGTLQFEGPVDLSGSHFKEGVDLSRSVFHKPVEFSRASFEKEAYFVQGQFAMPVGCRETKFGPSTRFHQATFQSSVDCTSALFDGMAEFLEVTFEQPVVFERSRFGLGTGFSGSRFKGLASFSEAIFSRETFFGFAAFESEAIFAGAQFLGAADFSHAEFRQQDDLAKARFDQPPIFDQTKRLESAQPDGLLQARNGQYALTVIFLIVAALLVAYAAKIK